MFDQPAFKYQPMMSFRLIDVVNFVDAVRTVDPQTRSKVLHHTANLEVLAVELWRLHPNDAEDVCESVLSE